MKSKMFVHKYIDVKENISPIQINLITTLKKTGPLTRKGFANLLKKPRTTIYDNLLKLEKLKYVEKYIQQERKIGRPVVFWKLSD